MSSNPPLSFANRVAQSANKSLPSNTVGGASSSSNNFSSTASFASSPSPPNFPSLNSSVSSSSASFPSPPTLPIRSVSLNGLVLLRLIQHAQQGLPDQVSGQLLGLDINGVLEVTSSFPIPTHVSEDQDNYQLDMLKLYRSVNVDSNTVGWYQSAPIDGVLDSTLVDAHIQYQRQIDNSVVIVIDPFASQVQKGKLVVRAYRLTDKFIKASEGLSNRHITMSQEVINKTNLSAYEIFEEIPLKIHSSHLSHAFLYEMREQKTFDCDTERLNLNYSNNFDKLLGSLSTSLTDLYTEQIKFRNYQRLQNQQKMAQQAYIKKREDENEVRRSLGKDALPEEDLSRHPLFQSIPKPNRLDAYLTANEIHQTADQIQKQTKVQLNKLYLLEALNKE